MNTGDIQTLYAYNKWANHRMLASARQLTREELTLDLGSSYGSVKGTLVHILGAEWVWLRRWRGESPKHLFDPDDFSDVDSVDARWDEIERDRADFIAGLTDERLAGRMSYENLQGRRWEYTLAHMMQHVANHSSYHRGQVVTLLRQLERTPPATDFLVFFDETAGGR